MRERSQGRPAGFKLCIGRHRDFLAILKAMLELETTPDFIIVDGGEGGTGAAPLEFEDHVGTPLTDGLVFVHNALVGAGLRDRIKVGASGKIHSGFTMASRIAQGADYTNSARAMMFAIGCIQAQRCHTNTCPVGVATQDPKRYRALDVPGKAERVHNFQRNTCERFREILAALGLDSPEEISPSHLLRRVSAFETRSYHDLFEWLAPGELVDGTNREVWDREWQQADASRFR
jgi:glutamate synthase domain-containing protein 2